jgi:hypothetical protein
MIHLHFQTRAVVNWVFEAVLPGFPVVSRVAGLSPGFSLGFSSGSPSRLSPGLSQGFWQRFRPGFGLGVPCSCHA